MRSARNRACAPQRLRSAGVSRGRADAHGSSARAVIASSSWTSNLGACVSSSSFHRRRARIFF
eukprot:9302058-Alexandrium_andersonii.AAC.1